jgi:hypothetical protein
LAFGKGLDATPHSTSAALVCVSAKRANNHAGTRPSANAFAAYGFVLNAVSSPSIFVGF